MAHKALVSHHSVLGYWFPACIRTLIIFAENSIFADVLAQSSLQVQNHYIRGLTLVLSRIFYNKVCLFVDWLLASLFFCSCVFACLFVLVTASQYSSECQKISPVDWDELFWKEGVGMEKRKERKGKSTSTLWVNISYKNCCICYWGPQSKFLENQYYSPSITFGRGMISFHFCMTA